MKTTINGIRYDTIGATFIGSNSSGSNPDSANWYTETLYCTPRSRRYFLAGKGGAATKYRNGGNGGKIIPIATGEAIGWIRDNMGDEYVKYFEGE